MEEWGDSRKGSIKREKDDDSKGEKKRRRRMEITISYSNGLNTCMRDPNKLFAGIFFFLL